MSLQIRCPNPQCRRKLAVPASLIGKKTACPACGCVVPVVDPNEQTMAKKKLASDPLVGKALADFRILEKLGEGGIASVYRANNLRLDKQVALKVIPEKAVETDPELGKRFVREARAAAKLEHSNIVPVYSIDRAGGYFFIEMQLVDGESLVQRIQREGTLHASEAVRITIDVAKALAFAHHRGVIHRDIKPGNIMLMQDESVKVTDFGLAKVSQARTQLTTDGQIMGTASYMSPEQCEGRPTDARSDIYSLGCTLFEMLTGRPPFLGENAMALLLQHRDTPPPSPGSFVDGLPSWLCMVTLKMLAKRPEDRYQSCEEAADELQRGWTQGRIRRKTERQLKRAMRPQRAGLRTFAFVAAIGLSMAVGIGVGVWMQMGRDVPERKGAHTVETPPKPLHKPTETTPKQPTAAPEPVKVQEEPVAEVKAEPKPLPVEAAPTATKPELQPKPPQPEPPPTAKEAEKTAPVAAVAKPLVREEGKKPPPLAAQPAEPEPKPAVEKPAQEKYVATAATGEKIPDPLSRATHVITSNGKKIEAPVGMVYVPAGTFLMKDRGADGRGQATEKKVQVDAFFIEKYEVTNAQYAAFVEATGAFPPPQWMQNGGRPPEGQENHPVVNLPYESAAAYAAWCGKRLPTAAEWVKAAGWDASRKKLREYPWGDTYGSGRANDCYQAGCRCKGQREKHFAWLNSQVDPMRGGREMMKLGGKAAPVGKFKDDLSPFGCYDMAGNVQEWVIGAAGSDSRGDGQMMCGGHWGANQDDLRTSTQHPFVRPHPLFFVGFRCALSAPLPEGWKSGSPRRE
ncbi:MAG: SUMF1/EgtB/PvdO family nonheme iron enzyme [Planctomycetota bacterium]